MRSDRPLRQAAAQGAGPRTLRLAIFLGYFSGVAIERSTIKLAAKLAESDLDLDLVIAAASEPTELAEEAGVRVVRIPPRPAMSARASALRAWPAALRDLAPVLVSPHPTLTHLPALAGYLRDIGWQGKHAFTILQGEDMGMPSRLRVSYGPAIGESVAVSGETRHID